MSVPPGPPWQWEAESHSVTTTSTEQQRVYRSGGSTGQGNHALLPNVDGTKLRSVAHSSTMMGPRGATGHADGRWVQQTGIRSTVSPTNNDQAAVDDPRAALHRQNHGVQPYQALVPGAYRPLRPEQVVSASTPSLSPATPRMPSGQVHPPPRSALGPRGASSASTTTTTWPATQKGSGTAFRPFGAGPAPATNTHPQGPTQSRVGPAHPHDGWQPMPGPEQPLLATKQPDYATESTAKLSPNDVPRPAAIDRDYQAEQRPVLVSRHEYGGAMRAEPVIPPTSLREAADTFQVDRGNTRPRFIRWTVGSIPRTPDLCRSSGIPLALYVAPFADAADEAPVPVVDTRPYGPLRCSRCHAYANIGIRYGDGGRSFVCNLCHHLNTVDIERFVPLDPVTQLPSDYSNRPELQYGSVEYIVPEDTYCERGRTSMPVFVLVVDAPSLGAIAPYAALRAMLSESLCLHQAQLALIVTSASSLHFFPVYASGAIQEILVPDTQDPFLPVPPAQLLQSPDLECWTAMMDYVQRSAWYPTEAALHGSHVLAGVMAAAELLRAPDIGGGKILAVCSGLSLGPASSGLVLQDRWMQCDESGTHQKWKTSVERERWLIQPVSEAFAVLGKRLADSHITLDLFVHPSVFPGTLNARPTPYFDLASLRALPEHCGGTLYYYRNGADVGALHRDLAEAIRAVRALEAVLRVRCSPGITADEHLGSFRPSTSERPDISIPVMSAGTNLMISVRHDIHEGIALHPLLDQHTTTAMGASTAVAGSSSGGDTTPSPTVYVQVAVLFTHPNDRSRRVRVHTLAAPSTSLLGQLFRTVDVTVVMAWLARSATARVHSGTLLSKVRDWFTEQLVEMLFVYRRYCASRSSPGQLILPEALKIAPLYTLGLLKNAAFRAEHILPDERAYRLHLFWTRPIETVVVSMHPLMFSVNESMQPDALVGLPVPGRSDASRQQAPRLRQESLHSGYSVVGGAATPMPSPDTKEPGQDLWIPDGDARLPPQAALTSERLVSESSWLALDGWQCFLWVGDPVELSAIRHALDHGGSAGLPVPALERLYRMFPGLASPEIVYRQAPMEPAFLQLLIEDRAAYAPSYIEYLVTLHKLVQRKLASNEVEKQHRMLAEWEWAHTY